MLVNLKMKNIPFLQHYFSILSKMKQNGEQHHFLLYLRDIMVPDTKSIIFLSFCNSIDFNASFLSNFNFITTAKRREKNIPQEIIKDKKIKEVTKDTIRYIHPIHNDEIDDFHITYDVMF